MSQHINFQLLEVKSVTTKLEEFSSGSDLPHGRSSYLDITVENQSGQKCEITLFSGGSPETMKLFYELNRAIQDANLAVTF